MGSARTIGVVLVPGLMCLAAAVRAAPEMTATFAVCTGQLSAYVEHHWLMVRDPVQAEADYAAMGDVLDAVTDPAMAAQIMGWRVSAKVAMREMLQRADLQNDTAARERAAALIGECRRLIGAPGA
jgi:alpha-D-ribose 1-methylphosphonate 5-triphosphate synthase subunit PhnG